VDKGLRVAETGRHQYLSTEV